MAHIGFDGGGATAAADNGVEDGFETGGSVHSLLLRRLRLRCRLSHSRLGHRHLGRGSLSRLLSSPLLPRHRHRLQHSRALGARRAARRRLIFRSAGGPGFVSLVSLVGSGKVIGVRGGA